jgi:glutamate N-acetyltransferase/amino-acid N-acetyltransferase
VKDAREMTRITGELLRIAPRQVLIASTGVIGQPLPMDKIRAGLPKLVKGLSPQGGRLAAEAIMTTDTRPKEAALRVDVAGRPVTIGGIAKGVGMIEPHMATMFCFLATDALVARDSLPRVLRRSVERSFNRITVDGDQSTSDTVALLANGLAENASLERGGKGLRQFARALEAITERLARMLVEDGEGATKLVEKGMLKPGAHVDKIRALMAGHEYPIAIDLGLGRGRETVWTADLSEEYVRINGKYTT